MSAAGRAQQMSTWPSAGSSSGSGAYVMSPDSSGVTQVWQTPVRQLQRVGTSQASARSSTLCQSSPKGVVTPLRAKVTSGPRPGGPGGWCGGLLACPLIPGLTGGSVPNSWLPGRWRRRRPFASRRVRWQRPPGARDRGRPARVRRPRRGLGAPFPARCPSFRRSGRRSAPAARVRVPRCQWLGW